MHRKPFLENKQYATKLCGPIKYKAKLSCLLIFQRGVLQRTTSCGPTKLKATKLKAKLSCLSICAR